MLLPNCHPVTQLLQRCFDPIQCVSTFQPTCTGVLELSRLPHALLDLVNLFLINKEEVGCLSEPCDFCGKREVVDVLQRIVEACLIVRTEFESPQVVMCVPWLFPQIMVRECI